MANALELAAMRRAIAISAQGLGSTSPNPPVGCVILDGDGRTVGEGYHVRKGDAHAEVNALSAAGKHAEGGTAVVTLEPCNHFGRTPPCRAALTAAGVARVLVAVMDPTSRGKGGAALLSEAGIEVERDFLKDEALLVLGPWLASLNGDRPFISWAYEAALDGAPIHHGAHGVVAYGLLALRESYDLVIRQDGHVAEGIPGSHGREVFQVPDGSLSGNACEVLSTLGGAGARYVLIEGASDAAAVLMKARAVDQVISFLPHTPHSWSPDSESGRLTAMPDGYRLTDVTRQGDFVRLTGRRS